MSEISKAPSGRQSSGIVVVIPAHNEARLISRCLEALVNQTVKPLAIVVVDNNSSDKTAAIARRFPYVEVVAEATQGIVYARNRGFDRALELGATTIARIDADSVVPSDWLERLQSFYATPGHSKLAVTGSCYFYNLHFGRLTGFFYGLVIHRINSVLLGYYFPWGSNMAVPAQAWRRTRSSVCLRTDVHEDLDLGIHLHQQGFDTRYDPGLRVGAVARRITEHRDKLWPYLRMWSYSLRSHGVWLWPVSTLLSCGIWLGSYMILVMERLADKLTRRPVDVPREP